MSRDTCESINCRHSVPFLSVGILGADDFVISYFIDYLLFSEKYLFIRVQYTVIQFFFGRVSFYPFLLFIYIYILYILLYTNKLYIEISYPKSKMRKHIPQKNNCITVYCTPHPPMVLRSCSCVEPCEVPHIRPVCISLKRSHLRVWRAS